MTTASTGWTALRGNDHRSIRNPTTTPNRTTFRNQRALPTSRELMPGTMRAQEQKRRAQKQKRLGQQSGKRAQRTRMSKWQQRVRTLRTWAQPRTAPGDHQRHLRSTASPTARARTTGGAATKVPNETEWAWNAPSPVPTTRRRANRHVPNQQAQQAPNQRERRQQASPSWSRWAM